MDCSEAPKEGDIIMYKRGDSCITHRVIGREGKRYVTKGDANKEKDPAPVEPGEITGKVVGSVPYAGYVVLFLQKQLFLCIFVVMFICNLWKIRKESAKEHARNVI